MTNAFADRVQRAQDALAAAEARAEAARDYMYELGAAQVEALLAVGEAVAARSDELERLRDDVRRLEALLDHTRARAARLAELVCHLADRLRELPAGPIDQQRAENLPAWRRYHLADWEDLRDMAREVAQELQSPARA